MAQSTQRIKVGLCLTNPYLRHPVKTAAALGTVSVLAKGRVELVVGAGSRDFLQSIGCDWVKPVKACREMIEVTRMLFKGNEVNYDGETVKAYRQKLWFEPPGAVPILVGCRRPMMLRMAGQIADGVLLDAVPAQYVSFAKEQVEIGARSAGRGLTNFDLGNYIGCAVSEEREVARSRVRRRVPLYFISVTESELHLAGLTLEGVEPIRKALERHQPEYFDKALALVTDQMIDGFTIAGSPEDCIRRIKQYVDAGLNRIAFSMPTKSTDKPDEMIRMVAEHVIPEFL
jgi:5,10-methylenetetrahydromethanopterin reductase